MFGLCGLLGDRKEAGTCLFVCEEILESVVQVYREVSKLGGWRVMLKIDEYI